MQTSNIKRLNQSQEFPKYADIDFRELMSDIYKINYGEGKIQVRLTTSLLKYLDAVFR